jgi:intein-encoded DNA endonuclease-like protein
VSNIKPSFLINNSLFYVIGAILGDGCLYNKLKHYNLVILNGDEYFVKKYAAHLVKCSNSKINIFYRKDQNVWWARTNNENLLNFLLKLKNNPWSLFKYICGFEYASKLFIEGFFDAEGCVKIIKESCRKTPKICLDVCNTNFEYLEVNNCLWSCYLRITGRYSSQDAYLSKDGYPRKKSYHLRIYKKDDVRNFLSIINTTKLKEEKKIYVSNWLNREAFVLKCELV